MKKYVCKIVSSLILMLALCMGVITEVAAEETNVDETRVEQNAGDKVSNTSDNTLITNGEDTEESDTTGIQNLEELNAVIQLSDTQYEYVEGGVEPEVEVFVEGQALDSENYDVSYENNTELGMAKVFVTGKKEQGYEGVVEAEFEIIRKSIEDIKPILGYKSYIYNGKAKRTKITMKINNKALVLNKDFTTTYSSNTEVGTAKVTIKGIGNYTGTVITTYPIYLGKVSSVKASPTYNSIRLSWGKVTGATGYIVYRSSSSSSKFTKLKAVRGTNLTNISVKANATYVYKVRAYRKVNGKTVYGDYSEEIKQRVQVAEPTITKVQRMNYYSNKIYWNKVPGATGYVLYRSSSLGGNYVKIGARLGNDNLTYIDDNCQCGKYYYYKIKAYRKTNGKNYYGNLSVAKKGRTYLTTPQISKNSERASREVTLKWTKIAGASGYYIYRSTSLNGTYEKVKTISGKDTVKWTNTGLTSGKIYYYKVKAFRKLSEGKVVYSNTSSAYKKEKGGWKYVNGYKLYYNASGKLVKDVSNIIGKQSSYVIKVNKRRNTVTVYAKDGSKGYIIPVKAFVCSTGYNTPTGTFYTPAKYRWHTLMGPCWGQWNTRIVGSILFHSVFYNSPNNNMTLSTSAYNKLGTTCSHGCVRLKAGDAKWIYDNCKLKTKVIIYNSSTSGPLGKPSSYKLSSSHRWDPTDPTAYYKCKRNGCH